MEALPHRPQLELAKVWRVGCSEIKWGLGARKTFRMLPSCEFSPVWQGAISDRSERCLSRPSVKRKPAASSGSFPGVRIETATLRPRTRISSGRSEEHTSEL